MRTNISQMAKTMRSRLDTFLRQQMAICEPILNKVFLIIEPTVMRHI